MDAARVHRRRHGRRRRLRARRRRLRARAEPPQPRVATTRRDRASSTRGSPSRPTTSSRSWSRTARWARASQTALAMMAAEEMDADWALVRVEGSAGARRVRQRLHRARVRAATTIPAVARARRRLRHVPHRALVRPAGDRRIDCRCAAPAIYGMTRRRRGRQGDAGRGRRAASSASTASECTREELARHPCGVGRQRDASASSRHAAAKLPVPTQSGAEEPGRLHDPPHAATAPRHPGQGRRAAPVYGIDFTMPGMLLRGDRHRAGLRRQAACRSTRAPPRRCPA